MPGDEGKESRRRFPSAVEDLSRARQVPDTLQTRSESYRLAFDDPGFMLRDELRAVRLQLELMKPELVLNDNGIRSTIVVFGSARIPEPDEAARRLAVAQAGLDASPDDEELRTAFRRATRLVELSRYYDAAREFGRLVSERMAGGDGHELVIATGGGPGLMEAANRGAMDTGAPSIGFSIVLPPAEQHPNNYVTPELCFQFHYFALRKMHFLLRARALVIFPGGYGTLDELFETLTLIQTGKTAPIPVLLFGEEYWRRIVDFDAMVEEGVISDRDRDLLTFVESPKQAWEIIEARSDAS